MTNKNDLQYHCTAYDIEMTTVTECAEVCPYYLKCDKVAEMLDYIGTK